MQGYRISPQQKRLWQLQQESPAYQARCAVRIEGDLQPGLLRSAVQQVVDRHEILRTTFVRQPGMKLPLQVVADEGSARWEQVDWSDLATERQQEGLAKLWEGGASFPLDRGPLLDVTLVTLSPREHVLFLCLPALCADARTLRNLVSEVGRGYADAAAGGAARGDEESDEEPVQYLQFSEWQNELLESEEEDAKTAWSFWRKQDLSSLDALKLPLERAPDSGRELQFDTLKLTIDPDTVARIEAVAQRQETTAGIFLLTCFQTVLWRQTGRPEIGLGVVSDGRRYEELHGAMGLFARSLPVVGSFGEERPFRELLSRTHEAVQEACDWQEYFVPVPGAASDGEFFRFPVQFEFIEWPAPESPAGLSISLARVECVTEWFKLKLTCLAGADGLTAQIRYDPRRFTRADVERLAGQFRTLAAGAAEHPDTETGALPLLTAEEREQLLARFAETETGLPEPGCFHRLFEQEAARTPERVALVCEEQQFTYGELNARANQVAHQLQSWGVRPDTLVALCVDRSPEMIIGMLGILKAGGAYVPLDPGLPSDRLGFMLADTGAPVLVTMGAPASRLPASGARVLCLDVDTGEIGSQPGTNPESGASGSDRVYVIYTSGSTGKPKGVEVEHHSLMNYVQAVIDRLDLPAGASFAIVSTLAADLGHTAIFPALCTGGCLHIVTEERAADAEAWSEYCRGRRIDCLKIVPSHLAALLTCADPAAALPRRRLVLGGEALGWELAEKVARLVADDCRIFNHYGPTETTVGVLAYPVDLERRPAGSRTVPLGRPLANTRVYVLDSRLQPVSLGSAGEVYVGGAGVARGYLNRPELTEARFVPDPFNPQPGARLYRTGDLARYGPDGNLEFLGRVDDQVKIRGFRIELGEIAAILAQHPRVRECVVLARETGAAGDGAGDRRIVAYVVADGEPAPGGSELRKFLEAALPAFMLPSAFVLLKALPLTKNGKIDRAALPAPAIGVPVERSRVGAPRSPVEEVLAGIWAEVLGLERVNVEESFFDLGGHSLLATQVISRVRSGFNVPVSLHALFAAPTVAGLALEVERALRSEQGAEAPPLVPVSRDRELPTSFAQQRLWFIDQLDPHSPLYNVPRAIRLRGALNVVALKQTLDEIVARHEVLRTTFAAVDGSPVQVIAAMAPVQLPLIDLSDQPEQTRETEARRLAAEEAQQPFDLARGPLLRATLVRLDRQDHVLLLTTHHIASDGWSAGVLYREIAALYEAFSQGQPSPLPPLPVQYADFAVWQREWLRGETLERLLAYWKQQLHGAPQRLALPADRPRPPVQSFDGAFQPFAVPEPARRSLLALCREEGATLFMGLLAVFQALLHRHTGETDLVVGTDVANRTQVETEGLIGFFLNHLVLRVDLSGDPSFRELLRRVREVALGAYANQDLPFDKLVEALKPERSASHTPLFQALFVLQNAPGGSLELPGLTLSSLEVSYKSCKFDLAVFARESDQGLAGGWWYQTELFDASTIQRMIAQYGVLLSNAAARPDAPLSQLEFRTEVEREALAAAELAREESQIGRLRGSRRRAVALAEDR